MASRPLCTLCLCCVAATLVASSLSATVFPTEDPETIAENIWGGEDAPRNRFQWICSIRRMDGSGSGQHVCTGSLIHPRIILTAAHCMEREAAYQYHCGGWYTTDQMARVYHGRFENHPNYVMDGVRITPHDISVITLTETSAIISPIVARDMAAVNNGAALSTAGWGYIDGLGRPSTNLKILRHLYVAPCIASIGVDFCLRSEDGVTCSGDSGGPAFIEGADIRADTLYAVLSGGRNEFASATFNTPIPSYLDSFITSRVIAAENEIVARLPYQGCPRNPAFVSQMGITVTSTGCTATFEARNVVANYQASVSWGNFARRNAALRFDVEIANFWHPGPSTTSYAFFFETVNTLELYIDRSGSAARWKYLDRNNMRHDLGTSRILPGSGIHKVHVVLIDNGIVIFEDGMKLGILRGIQTESLEAAWFGMYSFVQDLACTVYLTNIRFDPLP